MYSHKYISITCTKIQRSRREIKKGKEKTNRRGGGKKSKVLKERVPKIKLL